MTIYSTIKRIDAADGKSYVEIQVRDDGLMFRFVETAHRVDPDEGYEYWLPIYWSGLYSDAASAERDARLTTARLQDGNSN